MTEVAEPELHSVGDIGPDAIDRLAEGFRGTLTSPRDSRYEDARALYNGMIDKRPGLIARCANASDVIRCVDFARENGVLTAVRGGGHNGPGLGSCDGGLTVDLGALKGVRVDPERETIRVEPGCTQGDVDHAGHPFGLTVPAGIVSTTGIAGLTLGGGHGYLARKYGLTIDNLLAADVVFADGSFVRASETEHPDLFWALRGGGGNFWIVTSFLFRARPVETVYGGPIFWAVEDAREIMEWYREFLPNAPREIGTFYGMKRVPMADPFPEDIRGRQVCALIHCWSGRLEEAEEALPLHELPEPIFRYTAAMPFPALQTLFDPLLPKGLQWYWKGDFVCELSDDAIDVHLEHGSDTPTHLSLMHLYPIDGAVHDVGADQTAWSFRDATWSMVIAGIGEHPGRADELREWARGYWEALQPHTAGGAYVNFMMEEGRDRVEATYGKNYQRLARIKAEYDPSNLFRVNQNIPPAA